MNLTYVLIIIILIIGLMFVCRSKDTFGTSTSILQPISKDATLIFYAPWCKYCKDSMKYFEEAVADGDGKIILIDATESTGKKLALEYGVTGYPTIMKNSVTYNGNRNNVDGKGGIIEFSKS